MVVCGRCKAFAYCVSPKAGLNHIALKMGAYSGCWQDESCRNFDWDYQHSRGCSVLPEGDLVPVKVQLDPERAIQVAKVSDLIANVVRVGGVSPRSN